MTIFVKQITVLISLIYDIKQIERCVCVCACVRVRVCVCVCVNSYHEILTETHRQQEVKSENMILVKQKYFIWIYS